MRVIVGLVLEGGGARGAYQIGAYQAIREMGIEVQGIAGTSVGALNGAMIAQGDIEKAYQLWWDLHPAQVFKLDSAGMKHFDKLSLSRENLPRLLKRLREIFNEGGLDVAPLKELLAQIIDEERLRQSGLDFGLIAVSLTDLRALELYIENIPAGKLVDYLMASASLPGFKVDPIEGKRMIDGGLYDNMPVNLLVAKGYTDIIVLRTHGPGNHRRVRQKGLNLTYITPSDHLGGILQFDQNSARANLKMGYYDALKTFKELKGRRYYLCSWDNRYFLDYLLTLDESIIQDIGRALGFRGGSYRRMLFEKIIPRYCDLLGIDRQAGYEEVGLVLLEEVAKRCHIDRFQVYQLEEFIDLIKTNYQPGPQVKLERVPDLLKQNRVLSRTVRGQILDATIERLFREIASQEAPQ